MKVNLISSMNNNDQRGGTYLRFSAMRRIYELLGFEINTLFQDDIKSTMTMFSFIKSFIHGPRAMIMFKEAEINLPAADYNHFENLRCFNWHFEKHENTPIVYNAHNLEFENYYSRSQSFYAQKFIRYELKQMERAQIIFLCSDREKEIISQLNPKLVDKLFVLPNLVDRKNYHAAKEKDTIAFIGTLDYHPNIKALEYLCTDFMKLVPNTLKDKYKFVIAGRCPLPGQAEMVKKAGFEFRTDLTNEEVYDLYARTLVSLVPLSGGSGTRLKIVEGIMSGARIVSTPLGHEGIKSPLISSSSLYNFPSTFINTIKSIEGNKMIEEFEKFKTDYDTDTFFHKNQQHLREILNLN